jgi:predicted TIM-barrel fold metal-dependent hydrolase
MPDQTASTRQQAPPTISGIDCHAHVFTRALPLADGRRYAPTYDADIAAYLAMLTANGMSHGVLIQPSFLGTDNAYMLDALRQAPDRLRGIAVVDPSAAASTLTPLAEAGCVGIRLNLIGQPDPAFHTEEWRRHLTAVTAMGWQVEVQAEAARLPSLLPPLLDAGARVVVDHCGRPASASEPGFQHLLGAAKTRRVWVKLSAPYRLSDPDGALLSAVVPLLRGAFGCERLVWGSDWPHTQYESVARPAAMRGDLDTWLPDPADRKAVLVDTPANLFGFSSSVNVH